MCERSACLDRACDVLGAFAPRAIVAEMCCVYSWPLGVTSRAVVFLLFGFARVLFVFELQEPRSPTRADDQTLTSRPSGGHVPAARDGSPGSQIR